MSQGITSRSLGKDCVSTYACCVHLYLKGLPGLKALFVLFGDVNNLADLVGQLRTERDRRIVAYTLRLLPAHEP